MLNASKGGPHANAASEAPSSHRRPRWRNLKSWIESAQAIVTILGIIVGGAWTYILFIKDRQDLPQATIEEKITSVGLPLGIHYVQVAVNIANTGHTLLKASEAILRVEQILPIGGCDGDPCAAREINAALAASTQTADRFDWPLIASRTAVESWSIEPGESETEDFEFAVPSTIDTARFYVWIRNDKLSTPSNDIGWHRAVIYNFQDERHVLHEK